MSKVLVLWSVVWVAVIGFAALAVERDESSLVTAAIVLTVVWAVLGLVIGVRWLTAGSADERGGRRSALFAAAAVAVVVALGFIVHSWIVFVVAMVLAFGLVAFSLPKVLSKASEPHGELTPEEQQAADKREAIFEHVADEMHEELGQRPPDEV